MSGTLAADVALYATGAIMLCVAGAWVYLITSMLATFRQVPYLDTGFEESRASRDVVRQGKAPLVSVILPARNETKHIRECLESLATQDYENYEVIAVDDSSDDDTWEKILSCSQKYPGVVIPVSARPKPDGWMGKNWACMEGYKKARGKLLLFTDADTRHSPSVVSLAVRHLQSEKLDALTVMPRMRAPDFWIRTTLPMISVFLHTRFSALKVNDPASKTGYFFGSFFIIVNDTYRSIGMHEGVRGEMIEDGALGRRTKESGYRMRMVRGEHLVDAIWARDGATLWNALKRLMIPLRAQNGLAIAVGITAAVTSLLFAPFALLGILAPYTAWSWLSGVAVLQSGVFATLSCCVASALVWAGAVLESRTGIGIKAIYGMLAPLGGLVVSAGFLAGLVRTNPSLVWRGRRYDAGSLSDDQFAAV